MAKVSVCIPTFNRQDILPLAIESVIKQTYVDLELIVCDDGSDDGTSEAIAKYSDPRIKYIRHPQNIGKSNNMRSGFEAATGEYFIKFDDDDRLTPTFLEHTVHILDKHLDVDFVGTDHWIIDINNIRDRTKTEQNSIKWGRKSLSEGTVENLLGVVFVNQSFQIGATLFRRRVLEEVGYMEPNWQNCEDNDLFVKLALKGKKAYYLPELLMEYRVHSGQEGEDRAIKYLSDKVKYLESYNFEIEKIEKVRLQRLLEVKLILGLRLIQKGKTNEGRKLLLEGKSYSPAKALAGMGISFMPPSLIKKTINTVRNAKSYL